MADLDIQTVVEGGLAASYAAADAEGDTVLNLLGDVVLHVKNGAGAERTVTVPAQSDTRQTPGWGALKKEDAVVAVPAGAERFIGPFPRAAFNDSDGKVNVTYDAAADVTVAALQVPKAG